MVDALAKIGIPVTNHGSTCALRGYPGVSFVATATGRQVGAAAWHDPGLPIAVILLAPASSASANLGIADYLNYPSRDCLSRPVNGLRFYPPGNTTATFVPFETASAACSTRVQLLRVRGVVKGSPGQ